ncbi:MAG: TIM barrel protein [Clostridia bacterium]|nr:TIM barrel protein [Clostridia bacterium]
MIQSVNFNLYDEYAAPYGGWKGLAEKISALGLDGVEGIWDIKEISDHSPVSLTGYHLTFFHDWLDYYKGNEKEVVRKFGSLKKAEEIYGGKGAESIIKFYRADLERAISQKAKYVVFHVSDVSLEEGYTYKWLHTDREVIRAAAEVINAVLKNAEPSFDFLVENQWWPGFKFTDPALTELLLSRVDYPRKGIMLDTGHLMNTNTSLKTQAEGIEYILNAYRRHGALGKYVYGLHFHQSLSGAYVRAHTGKVPPDFPADYLEGFAKSYGHILSIDRHRPWTDGRCARILDEIKPRYLTHELASRGGATQLTAVKRQLTAIRKGYGGKL